MKSSYLRNNKSCFWNLKTMVIATMLLSLFSISAYSLNPGKIEGSVSDGESYATIPAAKVELLNAADSAVVKIVQTNNDGKYLIEDVPFGKYMLRISGMAYKKQMVSDVIITPEKPAIKFGPTNLLPESKALKEVSIFGYKLTGQMEDDKTVYAIKEKSSDIAQSGLDLLRQLPDINVDFRTNEVTLAGNNNILFQVNGKKVDRTYLMQLNPKLIDKIEIITNPGVKYDADVDAVINVILKKNMNFGLSGRVNVELPTSKNYFSNNNISLDYFTKGMRYFVSGWGGGQNWNIDMNSDRTNILAAGNSTFSQQMTGSSKNLYGGFRYGFDWFINDNNTVNFYSTLNPKVPNHDDYTSNDLYTKNLAALHTQSTTNTTNKNFYNDYSLFYKHKFAKKDHEISFEGYYNNNASNEENNYFEQQFDASDNLSAIAFNKRLQHKDNNKWQLSFKADYTYPITEKIKLSAGYNGAINRTHNSYDINSPEIYDKIKYNEDRNSAYGNLSWNVGNLNLQSGLRYEMSSLHIDHINTTNSDYHCFLPFASAQYKLGKKQTFRLNYRKSIRRPGMDQLSPFGFKDDNYTLSLGNPDLVPAYTNKIEFTHRIQLMGPMYISYRPYFSFINNGIKQINLPATDSITRKKYINVSNETEYGVVFSGTLAFVKWWSISPSYTFYQRNIKESKEFDIPAQSSRAWRLGLSSQFILPKEWVVFVEYNYSSPVITHQGSQERNDEFVTGFYKAVNKKFNITVFTLNPWSHRYIFNKTSTSTETMTQNSTGAVKYNWIINIRLGFNFSKGKEGKKVERQVETETESSGKKGLM